jgi:glucose-6-phosphate 1-epimerase
MARGVTGACRPTTVGSADGARLTCCAHGGQVLGWVPAGSGHDRLWLSPLTQCGPGRAIRGGIPVIFPQFAARGPLPKHGFARDRPWQLLPVVEPDDGVARWSARLRDDAATRALWPQAFAVEVNAAASGPQLRITLTVRNHGVEPFAFAAALHSYLRLGAGLTATVTGLGGRSAQDNMAGGAPRQLPRDPLRAVSTTDVVVRDVRGPIRLDDPVFGPLVVDAEGFPDRVLWNPGPGHGLADVAAGAEQEFVCVEPAALEGPLLAPGEQWSATLVLRAG